jgi:tetratricopeptide (TPR) repeat protein
MRHDAAATQPGDLALVGRERRASRPTDSTTGVASDEACLRGRQALNQLSQESVQRARAWFEHAIAVDGTCGPAYSGLARSCFASSHFSLADSNELMALAKEAALRAVSLNENDAEAHATLGQIAGAFDYDWQEALNCHHQVLKCRPASLLAQQWCAQFILLPLRRFDEAIAMLEPLLVVEPCELFLRKTFAEALILRGDYAEAIEQLRRVVALDPTFWLGCFALGNAYSLSGNDASAVEAYESAMRSTSFGPLVGTLAAVYSRTGSIARSQSLLEAHTRDSPRHVQAKTLMWYHFGVADFVQAAACLAELIRARDPDAIWVGHAPKTWRESPPVRKLLSDIGLA